MRSYQFGAFLGRSLAVYASLVGGCYASSTMEDGASGTRLRRIVLRPEDGEPSFAGWYDRELEADCSFSRTEDGRTRCIPHGVVVVYYEDSTCSTPVVEARVGCAAAAFARDTIFSGGCGDMPPTTHVFEIDETVISLDRAYSRRGDECVVSDRSIERARRGMRMDPARFVAREVSPGDDTSGPIRLDRLVAEDGSWTRGGLHDRRRDAACGPPYPGAVDRQPCLPQTSARIRMGGASCDEPWAEARPDCLPPELAYSYMPDECGWPEETRVFELEAEIAADERALGEMCDGYPYDGAVYRTRPADDEVSWLTRTWRGEGRLQLAAWVDDAGHEVLANWHQYRDAELGFECTPVATSDGFRCLPGIDLPGYTVGRAPRIDTHFADDTCTVPVAAAWTGCLTEFVVSRTPSDACFGSEIDGVYRVGESLDRAYRRDESGACVLDESGLVAHALTPIPLSTLALTERTIE